MSGPIRVLQVFAQMNRGGAETMIMNLYRNTDRSKIQFDFIVHTEDKCAFDDEIRDLGGEIFRIPAYNGKNHITYMKKWKNFFEDHPEYKIVHGHVRSTASIYLKIAKRYGLVTIAHSHSTSSGKGISAIAKNILQYPIRHTADYLFACSNSAGEWLFGKKIYKNENFIVLNNAIDSQKFVFDEKIRKEKRKELGIDDKFVIGHVGRFNTPKNHVFLIDIFNEVHKKNDNALLLLVGEGDLQDSIQKKVYHLGLEKNVIFTGVRSDVTELLQAMDTFVFPSLYEGLGIAAIEAQASGLTCFVSKEIPDEVILTNSIKKISLNEKAEVWVNNILKTTEYERKDKDNINEIIKSGYDIKTSSKWLMNFYLDKHI
jgi:glycosyltransferase involved in cell wall biosynthesis